MLGGTGDAIFAQEEPVVPESPAVSQVVSEDETTQIDDVFFLSYPSALAQRKLTPYRDTLKYTATTVSTGLPIRDPVDEHRRQWFESLRQEQVYNDKLADYIRLHLPQ